LHVLTVNLVRNVWNRWDGEMAATSVGAIYGRRCSQFYGYPIHGALYRSLLPSGNCPLAHLKNILYRCSASTCPIRLVYVLRMIRLLSWMHTFITI
jgi:hypothetical protein